MKSWILLFIASLLEIIWAIGMKYSDGFSNIKWTIFTAITYIASAIFLGMAVKELPLGTAYAIWTGIGAIGIVLLGIFIFHEPVSMLKVFFIFLIFSGIIGLKVIN